MINTKQNERAYVRWLIILTLNSARPIGTHEGVILTTIQSIPVSVTAIELRRELDYVAGKGLIEINRDNDLSWSAKLTSNGIDVAEYTVQAPHGIARPKKYWSE